MNPVVRPARPEDAEGLYALAQTAGMGMTTVPNTMRAIEARIASSEAALEAVGRAGPKDIFFFVLEMGGEILGMSSIFPAIGEDRPFYSYRVSKVAAAAPELGLSASSDLLYLCNDYHGYEEIGTLLVSEKARGTGAGRLLSLSRFLFMDAIRERLSGYVMAEIRGHFDDNGRSPFWDAVASKFFDMSFEEADRRSAHDFRFIADLMPKFPIYTVLLPDEARATIGTPHKSSAPAMNMLLNEGFRFGDCVDIFDAGPSLDAPLSAVRTVREARRSVARIQDAVPTDTEERFMVAVPDGRRFRCAILNRQARDGSLFLSPEEAALLDVTSGDEVVSSPFRGRKGSR